MMEINGNASQAQGWNAGAQNGRGSSPRLERLGLCRHNPARFSGDHQFLLRVNDEDARRRIRPGHVGIGLGIGISPGINAGVP